MSDLFHRIREAAVAARENVVVEDLRRKGLLPPKAGITINLDDLEQLMKEYIAEELASEKFILEQMRFGHFLLWLRRREEKANGEVGKRRSASTATD